MSSNEQVRQYLSQVRRRLRLQTAAVGLAICGTVALVATVAAVLAANALRFSGPAVGAASAFLWLTLLATLWYFLGRPLARRITDQRVARFVEEQRPEFRDRLVTAVELAENHPQDPAGRVFRELVAEDALKRAADAPAPALVESRAIFRPLVWAAGSIALILLLGLFGPGIFRYGTRVLWIGWAQAKSNPLYQIRVSPGNLLVGKSTDQEITAVADGFLPETMKLYVLYRSQPSWDSAPMIASERGGNFHFLLMNIQEPVKYYVESNGVRSQQYEISVIEVPKVERLEVKYHYPAYTGMADTVDSSGGDIMALKGTQITLTVHTDAPASGGRLALDNNTSIALQKVSDKILQATWTLSQDALYHVQLEDHLGRDARASSEYLMQAIADMPPSLRLTRPGHDLQPTAIDEVVIGFEGQDDVRLSSLELHYAVNGGAEKTVLLAQNGKAQQIAATHTLALEDYSLKPGDLITYYGVAKDAASATTKSDMFFLQVRPFERSYSQSQSSGGGGGAGGQENTFLSERQKEVISATWNILRQKDKQSSDQLKDAAEVLSSVQRSLQEQARTLAGRIGRRELDGVNDEFSGLADNLEKAVEAMEPAADQLSKGKFQEAMTPEQTALQFLLRAEALFKDIQVAFGNQGGGGSASGSAGRDLSDLFSLELDTSKNQYETLNQFSGSGQSQAEMQDALRKLQELARRQEELTRQQNQRDSMRAANRWDQEQLRRETEELARRLEQLARQTNSPQIGQAGRTLSQAARDMQQANQQGQQGRQQSAGGAAGPSETEQTRALDRLREASNLLSGQQSRWNEDKMRELAESADDLARTQQGIADQTKRMSQSGRPSEVTPEMRQALSDIIDDKIKLIDGLRELERQINESAARMAGEQKDAAKRLRQAASRIQDERLADKIKQGAWLDQRGLWPTAAPIEDELKGQLQQLSNQIRDAQRAFAQGGNGTEDKLQRALESAERVRQGLEQLGRDVGQQNGQNADGQRQAGNRQGQTGENRPGQPGQERQQSQQAGNMNGNNQGGGQNGSRQFGPGGNQYGQRDGFGGGGPAGWYRGNAWNDGSYAPGVPWEQMTPEQRRQLQEQFRNLQREAADVSGLLAQEKEFAKLADDLVRAMQSLDMSNLAGRTQNLDKLRSELTDRWKDLEVRLRRELQMEEPEALRLATQERVPEKYRAIVEEYYRSISRNKR